MLPKDSRGGPRDARQQARAGRNYTALLSVPLTVTTCGNCSVYVKEPNVFGPGAIVLQAIVALLLGDFSHNLNQD
jgi:hypothetical protein